MILGRAGLLAYLMTPRIARGDRDPWLMVTAIVFSWPWGSWLSPQIVAGFHIWEAGLRA